MDQHRRTMCAARRSVDSSCTTYTCPEFYLEEDDEVRPAEVYLYTSPLTAAGPSATSLDRWGFAVDSVLPNWRELQHWALVFNFRDRNILYEILLRKKEDKEETLPRMLPSWKVVSDLQTLQTENGCKLEQLGTIIISPKKLRETVRAHEENKSTYSLFLNNCQTWVKRLCSNLGLTCPQSSIKELFIPSSVWDFLTESFPSFYT